MRHRFTVALYDEYPVEAEILDYLVPYGRGKRQEVLRMLVKAGYAAMVQHKDASAAMMNAVDPDALALLMQALSGAQGGIPAPLARQAGQPTRSNADSETSSFPSAKDQRSDDTKPGPVGRSSSGDSIETKDAAPSALFEERGGDNAYSEFEPDDETGVDDLDDDDIMDPMAKLMNLK